MTMEADIPHSLTQDVPGPTKRRRKTGTAGAANDCFACQKKSLVCDRVRPYCGPCLQVGSNCSGYKTTLTWGVGVASRGKLRGKTLPIQMSPDVDLPRSAPRPQPPPPKTTAAKRQSVAASKRKSPSSNPDNCATLIKKPLNPKNPAASTEDSFAFGYPVLHDDDQKRHTDFHHHDGPYYDRQAPGRNSMPEYLHPDAQFDQGPPLHRLFTSVAYPSDDSSLSSSTGSTWSSISTSGYPGYTNERHTLYLPHQVEEPQFVDPFLESHGGYMSFKAPGERPILNSRNSSSSDTRHTPTPSSFSYESHDTLLSAGQQHASEPLSPVKEIPMTEESSFAYALTPVQSGWEADFDFSTDEMDGVETLPPSESAAALVTSIPRSPLDMSFFHMPKAMQFLINYYDKAICPILVAFDGSDNPYRMHIMHLAMHNEGLQSAIAALVTNNIRMRQISNVTHVQDNSANSLDLVIAPGTPTAEEEYYKAKSIEHLNRQLTSCNKQQASDDTVLATLLILCLFHVCNSGFSKFRTQLAGVQKLLKMRSTQTRSPFVGWVEMFFAWLDVMTSAVNDRETEIRGESLDMGDLSANLGALEQFSGCDGRLFKLIARLGRLNLLSQNRPVRNATEPTKTIEAELLVGKTGDFYSPHFDDYMIPKKSGDGVTNIKLEQSDTRATFWAEWTDLRARLWAWQPEAPAKAMTTEQSVFDESMIGISESFRYSALLYIERLAHPELPSSSRNFQDLVEKALSRIEAIGIGSCVTKFMLWPLFITGTEAVEEVHRNLIRERCIEIQQESGFYNNLSGLKVLERAWRDSDNGLHQGTPGAGGQAFKWRKAMNRADGEYIVI